MHQTGHVVLKQFSYSIRLNIIFILLINVKMPMIVGLLTFNSRINDWIWRFKPESYINSDYFHIYEQLKFQEMKIQ